MNPATISLKSQTGPGCVFSAQGNLQCGNHQSEPQDPTIPMKPYVCSKSQSKEEYTNFPFLSSVQDMFLKKDSQNKSDHYMNFPTLSNVKNMFDKQEGSIKNFLSDLEGYQNKTSFNTAMNMSSSLMPWP